MKVKEQIRIVVAQLPGEKSGSKTFMSGMKAKIDKYFNDNYDELFKLAKRNTDYYNRSYDPSDLISHAYEYCLKKQDEIEDKVLAEVVYNVIITHCYWNTSPINRKILLKQSPFEGTQDKEINPKELDNSDIEDKILLEKWFNDKKALIELYKLKIASNKPKVIVLDKMLELQTTNSRKIGKHFDIHYLSAYKYIREIQEELRSFEKDINNYDNKNNLYRET